MGEREPERPSFLERRDVLKGATAASLLGALPSSATGTERRGRVESTATQTNDTSRYRYPVDVVCGESTDGVLVPGRYRTAISIHNPFVRDVSVRWRVSPTVPSGDPSRSVEIELERSEAAEIGCGRIVELSDLRRPVGFFKGVVVVESDAEVDVGAVYSGGDERVQTLDVVSVSPRDR